MDSKNDKTGGGRGYQETGGGNSNGPSESRSSRANRQSQGRSGNASAANNSSARNLDDTSTEEKRPIVASISLPIAPQPDTRSRYRVSSGDGRVRKTSEIPIPVQPSRDPSMSSSRRSYSRGAMFGDIPEYIGSPITRRLSVGNLGGSGSFDNNEDLGIGASSVECESEAEGLLGGQKSYVSRISVIHPVTGETLFWGFSKKQWFLLFIFSVADLLAGVVYSLQAPFYPEEAEKKGATASQYGLVFGVFELAMFIAAPIYGRYMSVLGPRNVFNVGIFITGTCCLLFGFLDRVPAGETWTFIILSFTIRIVEAVGNAGFATATFTIIACEFPESVATTFASLETFFGLGLIVGPTVGGGLYQIGGYTLPFVVTGGCIFLTAILVFIFMPKGQSLAETDSKDSAGYGILTILKIPGVLLASLAIITGACSIGFLSSSLEPHIRQFNLTPLQTGLVFVINGGVYALTAPGWGWLCDRIKQTKFITLSGAIFLTVGFMLIGPVPFIPVGTILWVTCVGLFIQGLGVGATFVSSFILALRHSIAAGLPDNVATYSVVSGLWSSVLALGLFIGPSIAGVLYDYVGFAKGSLFVVGLGGILIVLVASFITCNGKSDAAYFRALAARSSSRSSESDPLLDKDDDVPDAVVPTDPNAINVVPSQGRQSYGATINA